MEGDMEDNGTTASGTARPTPTPYPDVNIFLRHFLGRVQAVLARNFVGLYLYGSLSLGDFDPASSDIDAVVVTAAPLEPETVEALRALHAEMQAVDGMWARRLEASYMPLATLRRYNPATARHPFISMVSSFGVIEHGRDWVINLFIIRERGVVVAGPAPRTLIDPITPDNLRAAIRSILCFSWVQHVDGPAWMRPRQYQAFTVLTMCRAWYVLDRGAVISKPQAATWAQEALAPQWKPLIHWALLHRDDPQEGDMTETLRFLRYTIDAHC